VLGPWLLVPPKRFVVFNPCSCNCYLIYRSGNTLRFPRVTHEPPRTIVLWGLTLATIPAGQGKLLEIHRTQKRRFSFSRSLRVFPPLVYVLRLYHIYLMLDQIKQFLFTFVRGVWSEGPLTPGSAITRPTENICGNKGFRWDEQCAVPARV